MIEKLIRRLEDEFLLKAVEEGYSYQAIGRMMKIAGQTAINRYRYLKGRK